MNPCPYCHTEVTDTFYFCTNCEQQMKCRECHNLLVANKSRCLVCGTSLVAKEIVKQPQLNTFSLEERQTTNSYSRKVNIQATDSAVGQFVPMVGGSSGLGRTAVTQIKSVRPQLQDVLAVQVELPLEDSSGNLIESEVAADTLESVSTQPQDMSVSVSRFFHKEAEDQLSALVKNYKVKSLKEQQQRFMIMYIWAYPLCYNRSVPSREYVFAVNKTMPFADKNYPKYFDEIRKYIAQKGSGFILNYEGELLVQDIIKDVLDSSNKVSFTKADKGATKKRTRFNGEDEQRIAAWIAMPLDIGAIDVRNLESSTYQAVFAIWAITKKLHVVEAIKPRTAYEYLVRKFTTIAVDSRLFLGALTHKRNSSLFDKNAHGLYYIKEKAEKLVDEWTVNGNAKVMKDNEGNVKEASE